MDSKTIENLLNFPFFTVYKVEVYADKINIFGSSSLSECLCARKMEKSSHVVSKKVRIFRHLSLLDKQVFLHIEVRKFKLLSGSYFWEQLSFFGECCQMTKEYEAYLFRICKGRDLTDISRQEFLDVGSVRGIFNFYGKKNFNL